MDKVIKVIGMGPGNRKFLTGEAMDAVKRCDVLMGPSRLVNEVENLKSQHAASYSCNLSEMKIFLEQYLSDNEIEKESSLIGLLASGDTGFFSIASWIKKEYGAKVKLEFITGVSSLQYFCSRIQRPYSDVHTISVHGRENKVLGEVLTHKTLFVLTGGSCKVQDICKTLQQHGLGHLQVYIGENLSYPEERILEGTATMFVKESFSDLAVILIENEQNHVESCITYGLSDTSFIRGKVPMTKEEIRAICLSKLQMSLEDCIYDIGAGTGSVSIEMARIAKKGFVYALEKKHEAIELIYTNQKHFRISNMKVIEAKCPDGLSDLPTPDKVFIGGSSGELNAILQILLDKNPKVQIVLTAITLETLQEALSCTKHFNLEFNCTQVTVANSKQIGDYNMMMGQNPIFILTLKGKEVYV